jgi:hypothetical protein
VPTSAGGLGQGPRSNHGQMINGLIHNDADQAVDLGFWCGAEGIRTPDPLDANAEPIYVDSASG